MKKLKKKKVPALDEFHYHEALDRTHLICNIMEEQILTHPVFEKHKDLKKAMEDAIDSVYSVYSKVAKKMIDEGMG